MANNSSMEGPALSCFHLPDPSFDHVSERYTMNLITAIINIVTASLAVICNLLICAAIIIRLRTPSNLLIASLALSDVFVGLAVQPGYIMYRLMENQHRSVPCFVRIVYANAFYICYGVALMTLATVSYQRFVAVRLRARYNAVFSPRRIMKYTAFIWVFNIIFTSLQWAGVNKISKGMHLVAWFTSLVIAAVANMGIIFNLRQNRNRMQPANSNLPERSQRQRELRLTKSVSFIVGVYLMFNLPVLFVTLYNQILGRDIKTYNHYSWTETLAFLNSCTNPLVCCWKSREIRHAVKVIVDRIIRK